MAEVTKCVCSNIEFEELLAISKSRNLNSIDEISKELGVGCNCRLCTPYIVQMLNTSEIRFALIQNSEYNED